MSAIERQTPALEGEQVSEEITPTVRRISKRRGRNPEFEIALGARIRAARIAIGMSQTALGVALGMSFQQVQKYERGADRITTSTLQVIARTLGVNPGWFFDDIPVPLGGVSDVTAAVQLAKRIQRVRDPVILKRLIALIDLLAEEGVGDDQPTNGEDKFS